jgi:protein-S-isoprenylcysteine O-methyltransferase Ste14
MSSTSTAYPGLLRLVVTRFALAIVCLVLILFIPAGTWVYWEAWLYLAVLILPMLAVGTYLYTRSPDLLARRMRFREREPEQRRIVNSSVVFFLAAILLPGLDHRLGWSDIPTSVVLMADALVLVGYAIVVLVFRENQYASRIVQVEVGQHVISTGPYAIVRHPMYVGSLLLFIASPLALGSVWATLCALPIVWTIVRRIRSEEDILRRDLPGYVAYTDKVRYRLVPRVW